MLVKKLSDIAIAPALTDMAYFVGRQDNGDGTSTDYQYTYDQIVTLASGKEIITVGTTDGTHITDSFFSGKAILSLTFGGQSYLQGENFTQSGSTITAIGITFYTGQLILATS